MFYCMLFAVLCLFLYTPQLIPPPPHNRLSFCSLSSFLLSLQLGFFTSVCSTLISSFLVRYMCLLCSHALFSLLWSSKYPSSTTPSWPLDASPCPAVTEPQEIDLIYQVLKQAGEISSSRGGVTRASTPAPPATATSGNQHNTTMLGSVSVKQSEPPNGTGSTATSAASFHRRSGPSQQQTLLLRGATSSLTVGPVPHASISGVFVPSMFQCS